MRSKGKKRNPINQLFGDINVPYGDFRNALHDQDVFRVARKFFSKNVPTLNLR